MELSRIFLLIAFVPLLFAGFASAQGPEPKTEVITQKDNGQEIAVPEGATFEVHLQQSGGTGYLWQIVEPDQTHLTVLESTQTPLKEGRIMGGPLLKIWKIKAVKAGNADLKILLYRPWEGTQKAADSFEVKIQIK